MRRPALASLALAAVLFAGVVGAQDHGHAHAEAPDMGDMPGMEHAGMDHAGMAMPAASGSIPAPALPHAPHHHAASHHSSAQPHDMSAMPPMQGGSPPPDARDPDYSDGIRSSPMHGMDMGMEDRPRLATLRLDQLEFFDDRAGRGLQWDIQGGYGGDIDKLWLRTEGERRGGRLVHGDAEVLWSHAVAAFWNTELGVREDLGEGPNRHWAAFGIQGLAPYWFELQLTGYMGPHGRTAARLRAEYELLFTQRLVLQPELEVNAYGKADPARGLGSGVSDATLGLRLRYEIGRQFAPFLGVEWTRRFAGTAESARSRGESPSERRWVAGVRLWL
ncbi:copper resistance protein B [Frateuria sp. STR12]|uniref:copper resistance protein B n=1 Tax=Frateuria hangzhouensis TaxID=2995589 RepID=UPI002260E3CA|nr:copper resistance protein B [Frateuria sp. STR12]MCX7512196.1 copper resistance protein B [Frateuria sp. STR12]